MSSPSVDGMQLDTLPTMRDARGELTVAEFSRFVPFPVARIFYVQGVPAGTIRGEHAHYRCSQYVICISGRLVIAASDGDSERSFELQPGHGLYVAPRIFATETYLEANTVLLVLCDRPYEKEDYIHTMDEFLAYRQGNRP